MERVFAFYETENGARPAEKFLKKLSSDERERVSSAMKKVQTQRVLSPDLFKKLVNTDGLWEVRARHHGNIFRLLCFFDGSRFVVVAHAFQKKTQKTPQAAIDTARDRMRDYFRREKNETENI